MTPDEKKAALELAKVVAAELKDPGAAMRILEYIEAENELRARLAAFTLNTITPRGAVRRLHDIQSACQLYQTANQALVQIIAALDKPRAQ